MSYQNWGLDEYRGGWDFGGQERRDQAATLALFHAKRGVRNLSYCLYLRPFGSVNRLTAQIAPIQVVGSRYLDFESILRKAVERLDGNYYAPRFGVHAPRRPQRIRAAHSRRRPDRHHGRGVA